MRRITVEIDEGTLEALVVLAARERRDSRAEAAVLLSGAIARATDEALLEDAEAAVQAAIATSIGRPTREPVEATL